MIPTLKPSQFRPNPKMEFMFGPHSNTKLISIFRTEIKINFDPPNKKSSGCLGCGRGFQPFLGCILFYFCKYYLTNICVPRLSCVCGVCHVSRACVQCVTRGVLLSFFMCRESSFLCGRGIYLERQNKDIKTRHIPRTYIRHSNIITRSG